MIYITGDTHGRFERVLEFCEGKPTQPSDVLIILGDAGINYYGGDRDDLKKQLLEELPITIFAIHGNHEQRPETIPSYQTKQWRCGTVYYQEAFPSVLFAKDGEIYDLDGKKTIVIGGAYSVDKKYRLLYGGGWWSDEQPSEAVKARVEARLAQEGWKVDRVLSHTAPLRYEPREVFLQGVNQLTVDKSTEWWLETVEDRLDYEKWYCGHFHTEKIIDRMVFKYEDICTFV